ncbi:MAG TPA: CHAD domain-containing protein, partial [Gemmatimonadales bacterium]|nr:CHAD domain-containing protein [Gemmatimonadales bacterium]
LPPELLGQPAGAVARSIGRLFLLKVLEASARLIAGEDPEAIHDFRVALRRLRNWLQAFGPWLEDTVTPSSSQRLRRLSRVAGVARDLQVQRLTLRQMAEADGPPLATEARRIELQLDREEVRAREKLSRRVVGELSGTAAKLASQLHRGGLDAGASAAGPGPSMAAAMAGLLAERLEDVNASLKRLRNASQVEMAHAARIAMKKLRYLLEPFGSSSRLAATAVLRLTAAQDAFGRLHDFQLLARRITGHRAKPAFRAAVRGNLQSAFREASRLSRSRDIKTARDAVSRLIRRLERRG